MAEPLWFERDAPPADVSLVDELTKLTELKELGVLTGEGALSPPCACACTGRAVLP